MLHLDLIDARQVVLDRVLGRDDLAVGPVQLVQGGVQGGRLARAGRSGHQEDAVRPFDDRLESLIVLVREAELLDGHLNTVSVQDPHDDRLAVDRRQDADAQVEVLAVDRHLDPAVLGPALFGDVDLAHDLDAGGQRRQQPARRAVALDQHAVDPIADPDAVGERLDVDIAGPQVDRLPE